MYRQTFPALFPSMKIVPRNVDGVLKGVRLSFLWGVVLERGTVGSVRQAEYLTHLPSAQNDKLSHVVPPHLVVDSTAVVHFVRAKAAAGVDGRCYAVVEEASSAEEGCRRASIHVERSAVRLLSTAPPWGEKRTICQRLSNPSK